MESLAAVVLPCGLTGFSPLTYHGYRVCHGAETGQLTDDVNSGLQAVVKNISSGSVKVKLILSKKPRL